MVYGCLDSRAASLIAGLANESNFDESRFGEWMRTNGIESKNNPSAWFQKAFPDAIRKGDLAPREREDEERGEPCYHAWPYLEEMKRRGFDADRSVGTYISEWAFEAVQNAKMDPRSADAAIRRAISIADEKGTKTGAAVVELLGSSAGAARFGMDLKAVKARVEKLNAEFAKIGMEG